jgi:tRNA wybutosine-synthesizing protein 3
MSDNFSKRKQDVLSKKDKSSIGLWDKRIKELCDKINKEENYYTTSSCSGRIVIMLDKEKKGKNLFIFVYHDLISFKKLKKDLDKISKSEMIKFKQEPCILHVACRNLKDAQNILDKAKNAGWKKSGIISSGKRFVVEMNSTEKIEFLLMNKGKLLVNNEFLELILKRCNENLKKSWEKISKLKKEI